MIKTTYYKNNNWSQMEYFCDNCFEEIKDGEILWSEESSKKGKFDLCSDCKRDWDSFEEINEELGKKKDE